MNVDMMLTMTEACCSTGCETPLSTGAAQGLAVVFKALSDPVRLRLLSMIASCEDGEICACDLIEPVSRSQATVSHHLSVLVSAGLLTREQRGKWAWFGLAPERRDLVHRLLEHSLPALTT